MPLLDIATPQSSFRNNLYSIGLFQRIHHVSFISGDTKTARWKYFCNPAIIPMNCGRLMIKAVATLEPMCSDNAQKLQVNSNGKLSPAADGGELEPPVQDEKELLRRNRISKANKGREAWNKGIKHSPETRQKIRERTRLAMRSPKVKMKLLKGIHNQTRETREKIAAAVRLTWDKRRFHRRMVARCHREWLTLISEASRKGLAGEEELQWDSYEIISKQLYKEFREGVESRKKRSAPGVRAPKTLEQRRKISEAIAAKWADPAYRDRVYSGIAKHRGKDPEVRDPEWGTKKKEPRKVRPVKNTRMRSQQPKSKTSSSPVQKEQQPRFKDPQARYKLEMIKSIRAQRAASDPKISEAILRANVLIGEAQRAAEALEAAAAKSPMAEASLIETRKLIAEAISYIKSIEAGNSGTPGASFDKEEMVEGVKDTEQRGVNGVATIGLGAAEFEKFDELGLEANGTERVDLSTPSLSSSILSSSSSSISSSSSSWSNMSLPVKKVEADGEKQEKGGKDMSLPVKKVEADCEKQEKGGKGRRWVCGRLVEDEDDDEDEER